MRTLVVVLVHGLNREVRTDLGIPHQEVALVESLSAQPASDLVVALARVARSTSGHNVVHRVSTSARDRHDTVALQRAVGRAAVGATVPGGLECFPFFASEVVENAIHAALTPAGSRYPATSIGRHFASVNVANVRKLSSNARVSADRPARSRHRGTNARRTPGPAVRALHRRGPRGPAAEARAAHRDRPGTHRRRRGRPG